MSQEVKDPRGGFANTVLRGEQKRNGVLLWLAEFRYSTAKVLATSLNVDPNGQRHFFKKLVDQGILGTVTAPTVRERLFMLTPEGRELARELTPKALNYATEPSKITASQVRHNLSVQIAVLHRLAPDTEFTFERHLDFTSRDKVPDALLVQGAVKTALEIELVHKQNKRIFRGFFDHLKLMKEGCFSRVEYVFPNKTLRDNYLKKFSEEKWPVYERKKGGTLTDTGKTFAPDSVPGLRDRFSFTSEDLI